LRRSAEWELVADDARGGESPWLTWML